MHIPSFCSSSSIICWTTKYGRLRNSSWTFGQTKHTTNHGWLRNCSWTFGKPNTMLFLCRILNPAPTLEQRRLPGLTGKATVRGLFTEAPSRSWYQLHPVLVTNCNILVLLFYICTLFPPWQSDPWKHFFRFIYFIHECFACVYVCELWNARCLWRSEEGTLSPETGVTGGCELPWVLYKNKCS